jgi:RNA polymerase sigma-70 factor (ECF subfamily)
MQHGARRASRPTPPAPPPLSLLEDSHYVRRILRRNGVTAVEAEDLVQEVLLVMWRRRADYDPSRPLRPWLGGIAVRVAAAFRKRKVREAKAPPPEARDVIRDPEQELATMRAHVLVAHALATLPEKLRQVVVLYDLDGRSMREIADGLAIPLFTAYSRLRMARQALGRTVRRLQKQKAPGEKAQRIPNVKPQRAPKAKAQRPANARAKPARAAARRG